MKVRTWILLGAAHLLTVALGGLGVSACGGPGVMVDNPNDGDTVDFIVNLLEIGTVDDGFDLDGHATTATDPIGCNIVDGVNGVDNALPGLLAFFTDRAMVNTQIAMAMAGGSILLLARFHDVDSYLDDPSVPLSFFVGVDSDVPPNPLDNFMNETFDISAASVRGANPGDPLIRFSTAAINGGLYQTQPAVFTLAIPITADINLTLTLSSARVRGNLSATSVASGVLGGAIKGSDFARVLHSFSFGVGGALVHEFVGTAGAIIMQDVDLLPAGQYDPALPCEVPASRGCATDADCPAPGTCSGGFCTHCTMNDQCWVAGGDRCDLTTNRCTPCGGSGACTACTTDAECDVAGGQRCDPTSNHCTPCGRGACVTFADGFMGCERCSGDADCPFGMTCNPGSGRCDHEVDACDSLSLGLLFTAVPTTISNTVVP